MPTRRNTFKQLGSLLRRPSRMSQDNGPPGPSIRGMQSAETLVEPGSSSIPAGGILRTVELPSNPATATSSTPRALTPEETKCLRVFRLTEGDRDVSYEWYKDRVEERVEHTCQWFLRHENFRAWREQDAGPLLVTADPGCGKSVLAKYLVDHELPRYSRSTVCYFFFKDQDQNRINQALCAVLHQLLAAQPNLIKHAAQAVAANGGKLGHVVSELSAIFEAVLRDPEAEHTILVFDALDECDPSHLKTLVNLLKSLFRDGTAAPKVKCLMTSRPYEQVSSEFCSLVEAFPRIRIPGEHESDTIKQEVEQVIRVRVRSLAQKRNLSPKLQDHLLSQLLKAPHPTYLWVYLVFDYLEEETFRKTERGLDDVLNTLPESVNDAYEKILSRSKDDVFVRKALCFVLVSRRPLSVTEMNVALHVHADLRSTLDLDLEEDHDFEQRLRSTCGLFLSISHGKVYLLHQTGREFLLAHSGGESSTKRLRHWKGSITVEDAELSLAEACVAYLRTFDGDEFGLGVDDGAKGMERLRLEYSENVEFLQYSVPNWNTHVKNAQASDGFSILLSILGIRDGMSKTYRCIALMDQSSDRQAYYASSYESARHRLHLAAGLGHDKIVECLLEHGASIDALAGDITPSPLCHAAQAGNHSTVCLLLSKGANVNSAAAGGGKGSALFSAYYTTGEIVQTLLQAGADPNFRDANGQTPLFGAYTEDVAQQLFNAGAMVDVRDNYGRTALLNAVSREFLPVTRFLLHVGADSNARSTANLTPLYEAARSEWWEGVEALLQGGANINGLCPNGNMSIWSFVAAKVFYQRIYRRATLFPTSLLYLIQSRLVVDDTCPHSSMPLHVAASHHLRPCLIQLLEDGAYVDPRDEQQATPLIVTASSPNHDSDSLKLLIEAGADVNASSLTTTPLLAAVNREWVEGVQILLAAGADPNMVKRESGYTALHVASTYGLESIVALLLERGADVECENGNGKTALCLAREWHEKGIARMLRKAGARDEQSGIQS